MLPSAVQFPSIPRAWLRRSCSVRSSPCPCSPTQTSPEPGTFFSPNLALTGSITSASRRNVKWRGAGEVRGVKGNEVLLQQVVLGPCSLPLCCCRLSWRFVSRTCSTFSSFPLQIPLCVSVALIFFPFYYYYPKHPLLRNCWSLETNFHAYFQESAAFRWLCAGCYMT